MNLPENRNQPLFSIGTVARMLGVAVQTLRMYERAGLILPHKSPGNQRLYSEADIERLRCIRGAITEQKIGIDGIRHIQSLIPCWDVIGCPESDRSECPAYRGLNGGCWTYSHTAGVCAAADCRSCKVYELAVSCKSIKETIVNASKRHDHAFTT